MQCGQGNREDLLRPTCVTSLSGTQIEAVAAGLWHTICICKDGCVYAFGGNQFGQLGLGTNSDQYEGKIYSWGWNKYGQEIQSIEISLRKFRSTTTSLRILVVAGGIHYRCARQSPELPNSWFMFDPWVRCADATLRF
ncbi:Hypothetical predicted protein [Olea europaea subsp. europaea]|uniref:Uncharacterized protein n=1 Tax=Olea europaea subsp. europaea TaxID=158383 RepID=A0A8S0UJ77_OLEEU|nr:Hypothetical predicted protein [Olea europaea subsp. europaea]